MSHDGHHEPLEPIGWTDRPESVRLFFRAFYVVCGLLVVAELVFGVASAHPHPAEEAWPFVFYPIAGFVSFWFLVLVARPMRSLLIRAEDYYEGGGAYVEPEGGGHGHHAPASAGVTREDAGAEVTHADAGADGDEGGPDAG